MGSAEFFAASMMSYCCSVSSPLQVPQYPGIAMHRPSGQLLPAVKHPQNEVFLTSRLRRTSIHLRDQ
jgi:hypothetical protein